MRKSKECHTQLYLSNDFPLFQRNVATEIFDGEEFSDSVSLPVAAYDHCVVEYASKVVGKKSYLFFSLIYYHVKKKS